MRKGGPGDALCSQDREPGASSRSWARVAVLTACARRSVPPEGKIQVWQHDVIPILVHLLKDRDEEVQANAAGALMNATVTTEGEAARAGVAAALTGRCRPLWGGRAPPCHPLGSLVLEVLPLTQSFVNQNSRTDSVATPKPVLLRSRQTMEPSSALPSVLGRGRGAKRN